MQADKLHLIKELKSTPYWPAVQALIVDVQASFIVDLVNADAGNFQRIQGGIMATKHILKLFEDVDLLRSLLERSQPGNPNVDPASDKE